ncbi:YihY/virulence factor BrkB family protein [Salirhabdus sp. Marseille-P4669]|uniref:YihY/virulence factor BrkB family protein n=1 Tax=Salirhabdus sp. Marseille-P4669 TaxID=2042310 RepID=UPI001F1F5BBC|nr:YihY/virulence factor BrkB family protein [Salirhabdus sp. Marseille-P4669]
MEKIKLFFYRMYKRFYRDDVTGRSAQLAYFFLLSLFPFIIFLLTLAAFLPITVPDVLDVVEHYAPGETMVYIEENVTKLLDNHNGKLLSLGLIGTLFAASNGINAFVRVINISYEIEQKRTFITARLISIVLTIAMFLVIIVALLLPVFGKIIGTYVFSFLGFSDEFVQIWGALRLVISFLIMLIVFLFLFKLAPEKRVKFLEAFPGALFTTVGWQVASLIFAFYVERFGHYATTYGSLGVVIVLMIWLYISAMIIILGGEMNATLYRMSLGKL